MARADNRRRFLTALLATTCFLSLDLAAQVPIARPVHVQPKSTTEASAPATGEDLADYQVGPRDVLTITVRNQPALTGRYTIEADGNVNFPLIGRVQALGLTLRGVESEISHRLSDGFFTNPEVSITIDEYRSQRVVVTGEVVVPGPVPLTGRMTLIEVLAIAKTTGAASKEAIIVRPPAGRVVTTPVTLGNTGDSEVIRVDLKPLETGDLTNNIVMRDGDTIFIPKAATVTVFGQVRSPGVYPIQRDTTLYQVLAMAGGVTDRGTMNRIKVMRTINGRQKDINVKLNDVVIAGDTIIARDRLY